MPCERATAPITLAIRAGSSEPNASVSQAAIISGLSRTSAASNGLVFTIVNPPAAPASVMPGLVPGIHVQVFRTSKDVDGRDKPGPSRNTNVAHTLQDDIHQLR